MNICSLVQDGDCNCGRRDTIIFYSALVCTDAFPVKPQTTEKLLLHMGPDMHLELSWDIPVGMIPEHCLNWVVEHNKEGPNGKIMSVWITYCINFTLLTNSHWHSLYQLETNKSHCAAFMYHDTTFTFLGLDQGSLT